MHWAHLTTETTARRRYLENLGELSTIYGDTTVSRWRCSSAQTMFKTANSFDRGLFRFWAKRVLSYPMLLFRCHSGDPPPLSHEDVEVLGWRAFAIAIQCKCAEPSGDVHRSTDSKDTLSQPY